MNTSPDWPKIAQSAAFRSLLADKIRFIFPVTLFFLAFYFTLPLMTSYSQALNKPAIGAITWAWVFAFAQFVMTWTLCALYTRRAAQFDIKAAQILLNSPGLNSPGLNSPGLNSPGSNSPGSNSRSNLSSSGDQEKRNS